MAKEKFVYNKRTLRYEKVEITQKAKFLRVAGITGIVLGYTALLLAFSPNLLNSSQAALSNQSNELAMVTQKFQDFNSQLDLMSLSLENIHERDEVLYRQVLGMNPTDDFVWEGGRGGSDKYADLRNLSESELLIATAQKLSQLRHQLAVSAESQEEIYQEAQMKEERMKHTPSIRPINKLNKKITLLSGFGYRLHPVHKVRKMHTGIDFGAPKGTPIHATADGKIVRVEYKKSGYGKNVVIDHGHGYKTLYGHMHKIDVKVGDKVHKGEQIGQVGSTGTSTSPHVHYEVIYKGSKINPLPFCLDDLSHSEYQQFVQAAGTENTALSID